MREILFRGKIQGLTDWIYGYYAKSGENHFILLDTDNEDNYSIDPQTVGQYTGLKDKNGKKIFEGDIVKEPDIVHNGEIQIKGDILNVLFLEGTFWVIKNNYAKNLLRDVLKKIEVIGNIYDNPELLEVEK